jgi:hypothetical protein
MIPRDVVLIGVPTNSNGTADGVARAPGVLRERGLAAALAGPGFNAGSRCPAAPPVRPLAAGTHRQRPGPRGGRRRGRFPLLTAALQ